MDAVLVETSAVPEPRSFAMLFIALSVAGARSLWGHQLRGLSAGAERWPFRLICSGVSQSPEIR